MDLNDLVKAFEEKFGVSAAAMSVAGPAAGGGAAAAVEEQTEFTVLLENFGANKVGVIRGSAKEVDTDPAQLVVKNDVIIVKERLF